MNCPQCRIAVPEGAVICDSCNFILDASFLGDEITNEAPKKEEATRIKPAASVEADRTRIKPAASVAKKPAKAPAAPLYAEDEDESTQGGAQRRMSLAEVAAPPQQTNEAIEDLVRSYRELPRQERIAVTGAGVLLASLALPWRESRLDGELIGLMAGGWPIALAAMLVGVAVFLRRHPKVQPFRERVLQVNAAASMLALLGCFLFIKDATVVRITRGAGKLFEQKEMWPSFGAYLGIIAAGIMVFGAVSAYLMRDRLAD